MASRDNTKKLIEAIFDHKVDEADKLLNGDIDFDIESRGDYPIHVAARTGELKLIRKMKSKGANLQQKNVNGNTPIHYAARGGYLDIVRYLKASKVDLNPTNKDGESPLHQAAIDQSMDVIESLVDMGMNPNRQSKETGHTPLHTALIFGRMEAMEGLLVKGAKPGIVDNKKQRAEDVAKSTQIRDSLRMYRGLLHAMQAGYIQAKGIKITTDFVKEPRQIDRVDIRLESLDIPQKFATGFYCRREKSENATVRLPKNAEEHVFSDVFHVRISDVNRDCPARINLPLYAAPSDKEEMMLRFIDSEGEDRTLKTVSKLQKVTYCLLETTLIPETTCTFVIFVRPKKEDNTMTGEGKVIKSDIEQNFNMEIPPGAFEEKTTLSLKVYEANDSDYIEESGSDDAAPEQNGDRKSSPRQKGGLLSNVFQINVSGQQPQKGVKMQIPLSSEMKNMKEEDIAIVTGDETQLNVDKNAVTVSESKPRIVNGMIVVEVSHFCIYVAVPKEKVGSASDLQAIQRQISSARDRRKPATFFVVAKKQERGGYLHTIIVECLGASSSKDRRRRLVEDKGYEPQTPDETEAIMVTPGDTFTVSIAGKASFEEDSDLTRKLTFSPNRTSSQAFAILLNDDVTEEADAIGEVIIHKQLEGGASKEVSRLRVQLHPPPPKPPTPPPTSDKRGHDRSERQMIIHPSVPRMHPAMEQPDVPSSTGKQKHRRHSTVSNIEQPAGFTDYHSGMVPRFEQPDIQMSQMSTASTAAVGSAGLDLGRSMSRQSKKSTTVNIYQPKTPRK